MDWSPPERSLQNGDEPPRLSLEPIKGHLRVHRVAPDAEQAIAAQIVSVLGSFGVIIAQGSHMLLEHKFSALRVLMRELSDLMLL